MTLPNSLSIIIPAYNEEKNIRLGVLDKVLRYLEKQPYRWEVLLIDDGSTDSTQLLLADFSRQNTKFRVIRNKHQGKAATVISGMLRARNDYIIFTDLDQATPLSEIEKILPWFEKGFDVIIGSRNRNRTGAPITRVIMARGFMFLRTLFLGLNGITDTQCGFKAFKKEVSQKIFQRLHVYGNIHEVTGSMVTAGFDIEVLYIAKLLGYKIKEVPVEWHYVETRRVNPLSDSFQALKDIISIRLNAFRGIYDKHFEANAS